MLILKPLREENSAKRTPAASVPAAFVPQNADAKLLADREIEHHMLFAGRADDVGERAMRWP